MSVRNDLITELESLVGSHVDTRRMSNDQLRRAVEETRAKKEAADLEAVANAVQDSPEIRNENKPRHPLQVAPGGSIVCSRGVLPPGDQVKPEDGEIAKLIAHGKVVKGPGFSESMLRAPTKRS